MEFIDQIIDVPELLKLYLSKDKLRKLCSTMMDLGYHRITKQDHYLLLVDILLDDDISDLIYFILIKLNISQSISNKTFKVVINNKERDIILESFKDNRLVFKELK